MRSAVPAAQWAALRELREGAEPTLPRLAAAAQVSVFSIRNQASRHRWGNYLLLAAEAVAADRQANDEREEAQALAEAAAAASPDGVEAATGTDDLAAEKAEKPEPAVAVAAATASSAASVAAPPDPGTPEERLARVSDMLLAEVEAIGALAQAKGRMPDKARIEAVGAMIRLLEKVEEFALSRKAEAGGSRDGEMADVLSRIDARIEELARAYAKELGARERDGGAGGADPG